MPSTKNLICSICFNVKPRSEFYDTLANYPLQGVCRSCHKKRQNLFNLRKRVFKDPKKYFKCEACKKYTSKAKRRWGLNLECSSCGSRKLVCASNYLRKMRGKTVDLEVIKYG